VLSCLTARHEPHPGRSCEGVSVSFGLRLVDLALPHTAMRFARRGHQVFAHVRIEHEAIARGYLDGCRLSGN